MTKKTIIRTIVILLTVGLLTAAGVVLYMFNKPHRDVQTASVDFQLTASALVQEYLSSPEAANSKYLDDGGNSRIVSVSGKVHSISIDMNNQQVVLLKGEGDKAGVSCTFTATTNANAAKLKIGQAITIKGVIRSGAGYDEDLELYEDVILEKCDVIN